MSDKITRLPVTMRTHDVCLKVVHFDPERPCSHTDVSYNIRPGEAEVECGACGVRLDPMFVLLQMAHHESQWMRARKASIEVRKQLETRTRCKCQHCGRMTRIKGL